MDVRHKLAYSAYDLSPIFILNEIKEGKIEIYLDAKTYEDNKEYLILK